MKYYHLLLSLLLLWAGGLWSQSLSLEEARQIALKNNPEYQIKKAELESAGWSKNSALGSILPSLTLSGSIMHIDPPKMDQKSISLNLSQPLFLGGKLWQAYQISKITEDMAKLNLKNQELKLYSEVENKYLGVLLLKTLAELSNLELNSARANLELATLKYEIGMISNADFLRLKSNAASKEVSLLQASTALQLSTRDLINYLGLDYEPQLQNIEISAKDPIIQRLSNFDLTQTSALMQRALRMAEGNNPGLFILDKSVDLSKRSYNIAKSSFLPTLMLTGSRQYKENAMDSDKYDKSDQIILSASIPLLPQYTNYANSRKAWHQYKAAELSSKQAKDGIKLGLESTVLNLISNAKQLQASALALEYSEASYQQMQERYRQNMLSSSDLIDIELMLSAARTAKANAMYAYLKSKTALLQAVGSADIEVFNQLIAQ